MSRGFSSKSFALPFAPPPATYAALVSFFDGDPARADAWLADLLTYAGNATTAEELLAALERSGDPASVGLKLGSLLSADISALNISPSGLFVAGEDSYNPTLNSGFIFTVI
jgi:hypothetical protein